MTVFTRKLTYVSSIIAATIMSSCTTNTPTDTPDSLLSKKANATISKPDSIAQPNPVSATVPLTVEQIQTAYQNTISGLKNKQLDSTSFKYSCNNEKSGRVTYYKLNGKLCMIAHSYSEYDHFNSIDSYFLADEKLYFAHTNSTTWSFESGPEGSTKDNILESRTYLINDQPVKCLEKKYTIHSKKLNNPKPDQVANKEIACASATKLLAAYKVLLSHANKPTNACLEKQAK